MLSSCLKHSATDVSDTGCTLDAKLSVVVSLTVRNTILADVLPGQHSVTGLTLEAADMPLLIQGQ